MRIPRIYTGQNLQANTTVELEPGPSAHIAKALRMRVGDSVVLFNGEGGQYTASIVALEKKLVQVCTKEHDTQELESPLRVSLGIAISRGDRMDWIIQKATELGVACIVPLMTDRTEVKLKGDRAEKKQAHWRQIMISACEQCGRNRLPELNSLIAVNDWLPTVDAQRKFVLHQHATVAKTLEQRPESVAILVGPEGGLSDREIAYAGDQSFEVLTLGQRVLRTETAPLAALAILQSRWGDMPLQA
ncbi:MAG: 16S rRNA (uracil1498-N3)-methyltransferase [Halioglobus sp.]|jgi:16S rRNA (uracil1498-N3)-methyltransferase